MSKIAYYEQLIQEKRKKTPFREFVKELGSWSIMNLYKRGNKFTRYPDTPRSPELGKGFWEESIAYSADFETGFFDAFKKLYKKIPFQHLMDFGNNENCGYADAVFGGAKNTYLSFVVGYNAENIMYSAYCYTNLKDIYNSFLCSINNTNIYMCGGVMESSNVYYSKYISNSHNIWFSTNLIGCEECILCDGLENQKYCIKNQKYSEEEYRKKKKELMSRKDLYETLYQSLQNHPPRNIGSENVSGKYVLKSHDTENAIWSIRIHNSRNVVVSNGGNSCEYFYDGIDTGVDSERLYGVSGGGNGSHHLYCSSQVDTGSFIYYCLFISNCHHCLGCIGLKNKSYCILNKQYTKEEWEILAEKIFASMEADGTLGEFFPAMMNPFYFNDTLAYLIDDTFTKEEVEAEGYLWRDEPIKVDIPEGLEVVKSSELDRFEGFRGGSFMKGAVEEARRDGGFSVSKISEQEILRPSCTSFQKEAYWYINPEIMQKVIIDEKGNYYRIVQMEYEFLMKHGLPLPRTHWLDRIKAGFQGG